MRIAVLLLAALLSACGQPAAPLVVSDLEITQPMPGMNMSAGYMTIRNNTEEEIRIDGVSSPQFGAVEIHETTVTDGISRMRELDALTIPAMGSISLQRGGKHLMLMQPGDIGDVATLQFMSEGLPIVSIDYSFPKGERQ